MVLLHVGIHQVITDVWNHNLHVMLATEQAGLKYNIREVLQLLSASHSSGYKHRNTPNRLFANVLVLQQSTVRRNYELDDNTRRTRVAAQSLYARYVIAKNVLDLGLAAISPQFSGTSATSICSACPFATAQLDIVHDALGR